MKILVAITCCAILLAIGVGGILLWQKQQDDAALAAAQAVTAAQIATINLNYQRAIDCQKMVRAWDGFDRNAIDDKYGIGAADAVAECRKFLEAQ